VTTSAALSTSGTVASQERAPTREEIPARIRATHPERGLLAVRGKAILTRGDRKQLFRYEHLGESGSKIRLRIQLSNGQPYADAVRMNDLLRGVAWGGERPTWLKQAGVGMADLLLGMNGVPISLRLVLPLVRAELPWVEWPTLFIKEDEANATWIVKYKTPNGDWTAKTIHDRITLRCRSAELEKTAGGGPVTVRFEEWVAVPTGGFFPLRIVVGWAGGELKLENEQVGVPGKVDYEIIPPEGAAEISF